MQPPPYIDVHTHLHPTTLCESIATFLIGDDMPLPEGKYAAGIHPWQVERIHDEPPYQNALLDAITPRCIAIGEIGLDYAVTNDPAARKVQMEWFRWQMEIAAQKHLPVIIHCVRAYNDLIPILKSHQSPPSQVSAIIHGFIGSKQLASQLLDAGCYLSFGLRSLQSEKTRDALQEIPADRMFLETDESTVPIEETYRTAADLREVPIDTLKGAIYQNYQTLFHTNTTL